MESTKKINTAARTSPLQLTCHAVLAAFSILSLAACSKRYDELPAYLPFSLGEYDNKSVGRFKTTYLVDQIDQYYRGSNPGPIGVTTLVNLDDLYKTSSFGRMYSEQVMSELAMRGYDVIELRQGDALRFMSDGGEFSLSREMGAVRPSRELGGIVVGTYTVSPVRVYVNARLIDPANSMILSAGSVEMDKTKEIARLLQTGGLPAALERIPVKHLVSGGAMPLYAAQNQGKMFDMEESDAVVPPHTEGIDPKFLAPELNKPVAKKKNS